MNSPCRVSGADAEIVAIGGAAGMEMEMAQRRHHRLFGLERKPFAPLDAHFRVIDRRSEHRAGEGNLARRQRPFAAGRALRGFAQRASPAATTLAGKLTLSPSEKVRVTSVVSPGFERRVEIHRHHMIAARRELDRCALQQAAPRPSPSSRPCRRLLRRRVAIADCGPVGEGAERSPCPHRRYW